MFLNEEKFNAKIDQAVAASRLVAACLLAQSLRLDMTNAVHRERVLRQLDVVAKAVQASTNGGDSSERDSDARDF